MSARRGRIDYHARMARVLAHVHEHLDAPLDLARLAELAHMSPFHWHRTYAALYGETIAATVRRLRLQRATGHLANSALPVADIARRCGYPNVQSFARAFREGYGCSPSAYRRQGAHQLFRAGTAPVLAAGYTVEVREVAVVHLAGLDHHGSYMHVGQAFEASFAHLSAARLMRPDTRWLAVYFDDPDAVPEGQLHARAGLSLPQHIAAPASLTRFALGGQPCAVLRHRGPYATMRAAYAWLYGRWLVESGHAAADLPVFEEYLNNPRDTPPEALLTDIFLPLAAPAPQEEPGSAIAIGPGH
ncbi:GyrI-like domain-containing protein [Xenophilus sp. Marseille-Q4582]|uniref:AraC family transcriptional regulator n=1 Tax=Xenophilus sp. Marseille-Q4582 TaxID=2866600 RepID=UPI001CE3C762|nr:AraC family transcriptional regulator [Xenophilus sp. Marseille-Q4582]